MKNSLKKFYVFPVGDPNLNIGKNPYILNLIDAIENKNKIVVNKSNFTKFGIFSVFKYVFLTDVYIFNWLESLQSKRFGIIQSISLPILLLILKLLGKKILVVFHNKYAHDGKSFFSELNIFFSTLLSDKIITHSNEGKSYLINKLGIFINRNKVQVVFHPVYSSELFASDNFITEYDYIIWGAMSPYKGIYDFLNFVKYDEKFKLKKILICGKFSSEDFYNKVLALNLKNITIVNEFITDEKLKEFISLSKTILFVYVSDSVLSSGALTSSLNYSKPIIGPRKGAFKDLENEKIIACYNSYDEIDRIKLKFDKNSTLSYLNSNSWDKLITDFIL